MVFPLDTMISHFLSKLEEETKGDLRISVSEIDASLLFDSEFKDFRVFKSDKEIFFTPKLSVSMSPLSMLGEVIDVGFEADYKKGDIAGRISLSQKKGQVSVDIIDLELDNIWLKDLKFIKTKFDLAGYDLDFSGVADGTVYIQIEKDIRSSLAEVELKFKQMKTQPIFLTDMNLEIPSIKFSSKKKEIVVEGILEKGKIVVNEFSIPGPDIKLNVTGSAKINQKLSLIGMSFNGRFSFSDELTKSIPFLAAIPGLDDQKLPDGSFPISIKRSLKNPKIKIGTIDVSKQLNL